MNTDLARILEPRAPRPDLRLEAVRQLNLAGVAAGVICAPVLPGITDAPRDLEALVEAAATAGAKSIFARTVLSDTENTSLEASRVLVTTLSPGLMRAAGG